VEQEPSSEDRAGPDGPGQDGAEPPEVLSEVANGVCWLTLNRPATGNAVTAGMRSLLIDLLADAGADPGVRAVVLTGAGGRFCTGADLRAGSSAGGSRERLPGDVTRVVRNAQRLVGAVLDCEKPVVAAVNGTAAGIGVHLALACDLVLAAEGARFIEVFARRGLVPDGGGAYLLTRLVGPQKAKELLLFGDDLAAHDAAALGLANRVVPAGELAKVAREWAERLAAGPTRAYALTKWLVNRALESDRETSFAEEALAQELNMGTADAAEGVRSFVERRPPRFEGR
jgi:2-(1,2-epoxy-1,2-dihydrophenyl)acetyl-CoA isomerase